jgi:prevent-host-death family protein
MKTINVRNLQHHLRAVLDAVSRGEIIEVSRRNKIVARIVPIEEKTVSKPWPDLRERLDGIYGNKRIDPPIADIIYGDRN